MGKEIVFYIDYGSAKKENVIGAWHYASKEEFHSSGIFIPATLVEGFHVSPTDSLRNYKKYSNNANVAVMGTKKFNKGCDCEKIKQSISRVAMQTKRYLGMERVDLVFFEANSVCL